MQYFQVSSLHEKCYISPVNPAISLMVDLQKAKSRSKLPSRKGKFGVRVAYSGYIRRLPSLRALLAGLDIL